MTTEDRVVKCLEAVLEKDYAGASIKDLTSQKIAEWDSLKQIELIVVLEEEFSVRLSEEDIPKINSAENIVEILKQHGS